MPVWVNSSDSLEVLPATVGECVVDYPLMIHSHKGARGMNAGRVVVIHSHVHVISTIRAVDFRVIEEAQS